MFQNLKNFRESPLPILIIKLLLVLAVIIFALLSIFLNDKFLGYGMIGLGAFVITLGIENKLKNQENITLIYGIAAAMIFFIISVYIFTTPF